MSEPSVPLTQLSGRALAGVPGPGERTVVERPPPGLARGAKPVSAVAVLALTAAIVLVFVAYYALRFKKRRRP